MATGCPCHQRIAVSWHSTCSNSLRDSNQGNAWQRGSHTVRQLWCSHTLQEPNGFIMEPSSIAAKTEEHTSNIKATHGNGVRMPSENCGVMARDVLQHLTRIKRFHHADFPPSLNIQATSMQHMATGFPCCQRIVVSWHSTCSNTLRDSNGCIIQATSRQRMATGFPCRQSIVVSWHATCSNTLRESIGFIMQPSPVAAEPKNTSNIKATHGNGLPMPSENCGVMAHDVLQHLTRIKWMHHAAFPSRCRA